MPPRLPGSLSSLTTVGARPYYHSSSPFASSSRPRCPRRIPHPTYSSCRSFRASAVSLASKNPYDVLGVKKDASAADIKKTYFSLARKYHPDTNPDKEAQAKFLEIQEAYDVLKDEKKRAAYDQYGSASQQPGFDPNAFGGFSGSGFEEFARAFGGSRRSGSAGPDIFEQLFGGAFTNAGARGGPFQSSRGSNLTASLSITFLEACKGAKRKVNVSPIVPCRTCSGNGMKPGTKKSTCTACGGSGERTYVIQNGFHLASTCSNCNGTGQTIPRNGECSSCGGLGRVREKRTVDVEIPPGVEDGMDIVIPGAGDAPSGSGTPGDLLVRVQVAPSKTFVRQGQNLYHEARIPMHVALLGGRVRIPTLDGDVEVRVPAGTQQGEEMVLKGRGVRRVYGGGQGDQFVKFYVQLPRSLSERQRELLQQFAEETEGRSSRPSTSSPSSGRSTPKTDTDENDSTTAPESASKSTGEDDASDASGSKKKKAATG